MPWRSESASLPVAMSYSDLREMREAMADGVEQRVHDSEVETVPVGDLCPVRHACPAQGIGPDADARVPDTSNVNDIRQIVDIGAEEVVGRRGGPGTREREALHS